MATSITPSQQAFVAAIQDKVNQSLSSQLDGNFETINYPAGFNWGLQFGPNNYYNPKTLGEIDLAVSEANNGILTMSGSNFSTLYSSILSGVAYVYSNADSKTISKYQAQASAAESNVISSFETEVETITPAQIKAAFPATKFGYISTVVADKFDGNADKIPNTMLQFKNAWQQYQTAAGASYAILQRANQAQTSLKASQANVAAPSEATGGLQIADDKYYLGFTGLPALSQIVNGLQTDSNAISVSIAVSNFSSTKSNLSINGKTGFSIPIADIVSFDVSGGASYNLDKYKASSSSLNMTIEYKGVTVVASAPSKLSIGGATGWYSPSIISEVADNLTKDDVTGFKLQSTGEFTKFGPGSKFSRVKTFVISQQPVITMEFTAADASKITSDFKENASLGVKLFGLFSVGSVSQSYEVQKVDTSSQAGVVKVTLGPPQGSISTPTADATAYVIGGVPSYPPVS